MSGAVTSTVLTEVEYELLAGLELGEWMRLAPRRTPDRHGRFDLYERRIRLAALCECAQCGEPVRLYDETDAWCDDFGLPAVETMPAECFMKWRHEAYGPAMGECCGSLYAEQPDGRVYRYARRDTERDAAPGGGA